MQYAISYHLPGKASCLKTKNEAETLKYKLTLQWNINDCVRENIIEGIHHRLMWNFWVCFCRLL